MAQFHRLSGAARQERIENLEAALGASILRAFDDESVSEVSINNDGGVWVERGDISAPTDEVLSEARREIVWRALADIEGKTLGPKNPALAATLPGGQRVQVMIAPASIGGTSISIRNPAKRRFVLDDYVNAGRATEDHVHAIREAIRRRDNVWVIGGTSSGKSTMMGAITREPDFYNDRLIVIQDRLELLCEKAPNKVLWLVDEITMQQAVMHALRMFIQRLVIGEVRDGSMWDVVKAANTGHDGGLLSLHANDPDDAIDRAVQLSLEATHAPSEKWIRDSVGSIIWMGKGRRVLGVLRVDNGKFQTVAGAS